MHGRVKVRTSDQQEKARREKKIKVDQEFQTATKLIFQARHDGLYTESQLHQLDGLVEICPDMTTLWNYRREILLRLFKDPVGSPERNVKLLNSELSLIARCLLISPKSYTIWLHRCWVMMNQRHPSWTSEVELCNTALNTDERNFHCWDYRRFIVAMGLIPIASELQYTESAIERNISNYSAWHYRSELLSTHDPVLGSSLPLSPPPQMREKNGFSARENVSLPKDEVDMVQNAVYTDPKDQSPWYFYWWILGRGRKSTYLRDLYISRSIGRLILVFTAAKPLSAIKKLGVEIKVSTKNQDGSGDSLLLTPESLGNWKSALRDPVSAVWWLPISPSDISSCAPEHLQDVFYSSSLNFDVSVSIPNADSSDDCGICRVPGCFGNHLFCVHCTLDSTQNESLTHVDLDPLRLLNQLISPTNEPESLADELENVRELVSMEPENKWGLLTLIALLRFVHPPGSEIEVKKATKVLCSNDTQRTAYYNDMITAFAVQDALVDVLNVHSREIAITNLKMSRLLYLDWFALMTKIDFSGNKISKLPETIAYLICLTDFILDDNELVNLNGISRLPSLLHLSVQWNRLATFSGIEELLLCPSLKTVRIHGNKVTELNDFTKLIVEHPSSMNRGHSFIVMYEKPLHV